MRNTANFNFYCRKCKVNKKGEAPIELSIIINGERHILSLPMRVKPEEFNKKRKPQYLEDYLTSVRTDINTYIAKLSVLGQAITADSIAKMVRNGGQEEIYTIKQLFKDYEKVLEARVDVDMDFNHFRKYTLTRDYFFHMVDINRPASSISNADILTFRASIYKKMSESTAGGYMSRLKAYIRYGMDNAKITINPFQNIRIKRVEKPVETITEEELENIRNKDMVDRIGRIRDIFVFSCGTGLAYKDIALLKKGDVQEKDGKLVIFKQRAKTEINFYSVLMPMAVDIWKKYDGQLPIISNQRTNSYLKEIQDICGIESVSSLHFHLARHYYATYAINAGIPLEVVQKLVGHSNIKQTQHYAKMMKSTVIKSVMKHTNF